MSKEEEEVQNSLSKTIDYYENYISKLNNQNVMFYTSARNYENQLALTEKALELACEELYDHIAICNYCQHTICGECPNECPDSISLLIEYFKKNAKREMMKSE